MDYEKKYKEALERAKELIAKWSGKNKDFYINDYSYIFPELAESEDERMIKWLHYLIEIAYTTDLAWDISKDDTLAWLEKQKEQEHPDGCFTCDEYKKGYEAGRLNGVTAGYNKAMKEQKSAGWTPTEEQFNYLAKAITTLGEQGDCKTAGVLNEIRKGIKCSFPDWKVSPDYPEEGCNVSLNGEVKKIQGWSEEDKRVIRDACCWIAEYAGFLMSENKDKAEILWKLSEKLKSLHPQPKQEWSEEDKHNLNSVINLVHATTDGAWGSCIGDGIENWLKNLPERFNLQPKQEWTEEDEAMRNNIIRVLSAFVGTVECESNPSLSSSYPTYLREVDWLKSLRPQPKQEKSDYITPHKQFFKWIYDRLVSVHKENPDADYMISFKKRIEELSFDNSSWKPSEDEERLINTSISFLKDFADKGYENAVECIDWLKSKLYEKSTDA